MLGRFLLAVLTGALVISPFALFIRARRPRE